MGSAKFVPPFNIDQFLGKRQPNNFSQKKNSKPVMDAI